ncbi:diaminopimelate decarboxylase [Aliarcobacter skirrowii]|jgi:diaminopimelate decarboxylase|uniref:Diaminopimelate decarboxylase n=2 Tax=Aliarcobacter skirrowii TaxID=28200 RepID=A0A2U2C1G2_9BACT|nr:diaminopimelate decarboxylase [Aliarcobacter skirrowii]AXX85602.1 diaminopimelate decarboxylase [Aliarcobacter skirrowii CCUG 10374]KAB0620989.1 diaminopimelate decarboxylase [Aliarcobacter skirrowii CCUG 10374]MDX4025343.1 diaminopimelate decarboxylase [Aliarcobacter skirrowii]MDX4034938.1 diaminopimelate decarboxylase [Aliarcobacter skirrowii]MDX4038817.1 diaminopimelate decarboxylase [Aliarcobacter skirrowii]
MNIDFKTLAQKYQTPYYVYDFDYIKKQYTELKESFRARKSLIAYAVKANSNLSVIQHLANLGAGADCVSIGEVKRALKVGIPSYKIIFSGVGKSDEEIKEALTLDILLINVESAAELNKVETIAKELNKVARISIRVNPNIDPQTHPYISTGLHENKFGVDIDTAKRMYIQCKNSDFLEPTGIHCHIGSQLTQLQPIKDAVKIVADLVRNLKAIKIELSFMDVGGGLGIIYDEEKLIDTYEYAQSILDSMFGLDLTVICEPGRFIVGNSGYFVTKVLYEKINGNKRFVIVDGAMNDLIRPALYNAYHKIEVLNDNKNFSNCNLVGPVCESGDFFAKNIDLQETQSDDLVVIHSAGAYGFTMSSNYNTRGRVAEIAVENGVDRLIRRREKFEDLIALEEEFIK